MANSFDDEDDIDEKSSFLKSLSDLKLPKDIMNLVVQTVVKSKDEITQKVIKELVAIARKVDLVKEVSKFAEEHKFKITAEIEITRKEKK